MKYKLSTDYTAEEIGFLARNNCEILSEIRLGKTDFSDNETPRRMFRYGGEYIAEIIDGESGETVWAVLSKFKGVYRFTAYYSDLSSLRNGL
ncbi:MAG: hypothetical protein K2O14_07280 [Oscillospiraceae bacterium]|nr:hypothetical protein [Oscillospiraceae bacterium]